jgi:hypothetical protein
MSKGKMGRLLLGSCIGVCVVTVFIWAAWTPTRSSKSISPESNTSGITLPSGYLPTMPYPALKGSMVDLSAEKITNFDGFSSSADLEFDSRNYTLLTPDSGPERNSISSGIRNSATGNDPVRKLMQARRAPQNQELLQAAFVLYGSSFQSLFSSAFKKPEDLSAEANQAANPFTEAKQDTESSSSSNKETSSAPAKSQSPAKAAADPGSQQASQAPTPTPTPAQGGSSLPPVLFLGNWDGSGVLKATSGYQFSGSSFLFSDGQRSFNFYINPSAVEYQRSLAVEDVNGDGVPDLLVTGRDSLFGYVMLGDSTGGFHLFDSFLTGWEPILAIPGPYVNGLREIVTVDTRSGEVDGFSYNGKSYSISRQMLGFDPDYAAHLVDTLGTDYLMIGNVDQPSSTYQFLGDGTLQQTAASLPSAPSMDMYQNFPGTGNWRLRCYQVGGYASIVLTKETGETFNVANLKVMPGVFIAIGDLSGNGTVDVAVALPQ